MGYELDSPSLYVCAHLEGKRQSDSFFQLVFFQVKSTVFAHSAEILDKVNVSPPNEVIPSSRQYPHV